MELVYLRYNSGDYNNQVKFITRSRLFEELEMVRDITLQ